MRGTLTVTVLQNDTASRPEVRARHGLALLIEYGPTRVLFDTGPDETVVSNAQAVGVSLRPLTAIVLSHGHYDHTGGLAAVLAVAGETRIIAHRDVFAESYARDAQEGLHFIGPPLSQEEYEQRGAHLELSATSRQVGPGLLTTGEVPQEPTTVVTDARLLRSEQGSMRPDPFRDDLSLVALLDGCSVVITGCAHAGLLNILRQAGKVAPGRRPRVVLGGLHLGAAPDEAVAALAAEVYAGGVRTLLPGHCTGEHATEVLQENFPGEVILLGAGMQVCFDRAGNPETKGL